MGDGPGTWECESTSGIVAISVRSLRIRVSEAMAGVLSGGEVCNDYNERLTSFVNSAIPGGDCKSVRRKRKNIHGSLSCLLGIVCGFWLEWLLFIGTNTALLIFVQTLRPLGHCSPRADGFEQQANIPPV